MNNILERLKQGICICNQQGGIMWCNQEMIRILGHEREELVGQDVSTWFKGCKILDKSMRDQTIVCNLKTKREDRLYAIEVIEEEYQGKPSLYIIGKETSNEINIITAFLKAVQIELCIKNSEDKYVYMNPAAMQRIDVNERDFFNKSDEDFFDEEQCMIYKREDDYVRSTRKITIIEQLKYVNGHEKHYEVTKIPFEMDEEVYVGIVMRDITLHQKVYRQWSSNLESLEAISDDGMNDEGTDSLINIRQVLEDYVGTSFVNIWRYDEVHDSIMPAFRNEILDSVIGENGFSVSRTQVEKFRKGDFNKIRAVNEFPIFEGQNTTDYTKPVQYLVTYPVMYKGEFLGILSMVYDEYPDSRVTANYIIDNLCEHLAFTIKKEKICEGLEGEWRKRIEAEKELQVILDVATDIAIKVTREGKLIDIYSGAADIFGWSREEFFDLKTSEGMHSDDVKRMYKIWREIDKQVTPQLFVVKGRKKDGQLIWVQWTCVYIKEKDYILFTGKDITYQKQLEEKEEAANKVLQMEQVKNEFLSNISHELKTPLAIILASIQMLKGAVEDGEVIIVEGFNVDKYMRMLQQNSYRLLRLVNNLIDVTKIDAGYYKIECVNTNIIHVVEDITLSVVGYAENKQISLIFDTEEEEAIISCDPEKIERIMLNILSNAIKHTPYGGKIAVDIQVDEHYVNIRTMDTGSGIPEDKLESIFDRFIQVENLLTRRVEGSGIGLSLVKSLVELHGGTVMAESIYGKGTEIIVKLPRKQLDGIGEIIEIPVNTQDRLERCNIEFSDIYEI